MYSKLNKFTSVLVRPSVLLTFSAIFILFYIYLAALSQIDTCDRPTDFYNAYLHSQGQVMQKDYQTIFPGVIFFYSLFFKVFPSLGYLQIRLIGIGYMVILLFAIGFLLKKLSRILCIENKFQLLLISVLLCIPFYNFRRIEVDYNTMPILLITFIFILLLYGEKKFSFFLIGLITAFLILIKVTFALLIPLILAQLLFAYKLNPFKNFFDKKIILSVLLFLFGVIIPLSGFFIYLNNTNALKEAIQIYHFISSQTIFESKIFAYFGNISYLLPESIFICICFYFLHDRKFGPYYLLIIWILYHFFTYKFLHPLYKTDIFTDKIQHQIIGSTYLGILLFTLIKFKIPDILLKYKIIIIIIIVAYIMPLGSSSTLSLSTCTILMAPLLICLLLASNQNNLLLKCIIPIFFVMSMFHVKTKVSAFFIHKIILNDKSFICYSEPKLKHLYDPKNKVTQIETVTKKMRELMPGRTNCLIYPRFPIAYWLIETTIPSCPKVDLENCFNQEWVDNNYQKMVDKSVLPKYIFQDELIRDCPIYYKFNDLIKTKYEFAGKVEMLNIYSLK